MNILHFSIGLTVLSNVLYHATQKSISENGNPIVSLIVTYVVAIVFSFLLLPFYPHSTGIVASLSSLNWASYVLGLSIIGVELGYLLAYRAGGNLNTTAISITLLVTILLIPIGILLFQEPLSMKKLLGVTLGIASIVLLASK